MSFKAIRSVFAAFMIAAFVVSLLPVTYASQAGQSAQALRVRRGKNGAAASNSTAPQEADRTGQAESNQTEPATSPTNARGKAMIRQARQKIKRRTPHRRTKRVVLVRADSNQ